MCDGHIVPQPWFDGGVNRRHTLGPVRPVPFEMEAHRYDMGFQKEAAHRVRGANSPMGQTADLPRLSARKADIVYVARRNDMLDRLRLAIRIAEGTRAKLDFDFACGRGHSFGEYHVHGAVNEILCSGLDPMRYRIHSGFAHPNLQTLNSSGRRREVDFAVSSLIDGTNAFYAEVKWAGSSHCSQENVLRDLCCLQIIKNAEPAAECVFVLAGPSDDIEKLFADGILVEGTQCLLHRKKGRALLKSRGSKRRTKRFSIDENADHVAQLKAMRASILRKLPLVPDLICTCLTYSAQSAPGDSRFQTLVWSVEA